MSDTPSQTVKQSSLFWRVLIPVALALASSYVAIFYGHRIYDHFAAQAFAPSSEVAQIHDSLGLTKEGSDILYASQPSLESGASFNQSCQSSERTAAILGCYYMRRVYVYDVTNQELAGAKEVTTAHEMLHAAYERLNFFERSKIDKLLEDEYYRLQRDAKVKQLMEYYKKAEPAALTNELHSILGTVVSGLSPELEAYYARYFNNRKHIVEVNNNYYAVFAEVDAKSKELSDKISVLNRQILKDKDSYQTAMEQLKNDIDAYKTRNYTSVRESQADMRALNSRISLLENSRLAINALVDQLNALIKEQNNLNVRANELNSSINGIDSDGVSL